MPDKPRHRPLAPDGLSTPFASASASAAEPVSSRWQVEDGWPTDAAPRLLLDGALRHACPLCRQLMPGAIRVDSRCAQCHSPLARLPAPTRQGHELLGRRGAVRRDQSHVALVHQGWPSPALPVRWRDLSLGGLSFYAPQPVAKGRRLRLIDSALDGVVEVVACRAQGRVHTVHARWLTGLLLQTKGVFVSAQA